jgi:hypothetical protein
VTIVLPDRSSQPIDLVRIGQFQKIRFLDTTLAGTYQLIVHTYKGDRTDNFIVQSARDESDLTPLTPQRWSELAASLGFTRMDAQTADLAAQAADRRGGHEMWLALIGLVLGMTVAESAFSRWLSSEA